MEANFCVTATELNSIHDWRPKNVRVQHVTLTCKIQVVKSLLRPAIHLLKVVPEVLLNHYCKVMLALALLKDWSKAVNLIALMLS